LLFLPERKVEDALQDGGPLPAPLPAVLVGAYESMRSGRGGAVRAIEQPVRVAPGSLKVGSEAW
jgi:hypothetical protein